jgi:RES domain-containing protein
MPAFYRIVQARWADTAMSGEGAQLHGGRWNPPGIPAVYLADSRALAALEILVHAPKEALRLDWRIIEVDVPLEWIESVKLEDLPADWRVLPSSPGARRIGESWLRKAERFALCMPSVIVPDEQALLINPLHPLFQELRVGTPHDFRFDHRLSGAI